MRKRLPPLHRRARSSGAARSRTATSFRGARSLECHHSTHRRTRGPGDLPGGVRVRRRAGAIGVDPRHPRVGSSGRSFGYDLVVAGSMRRGIETAAAAGDPAMVRLRDGGAIRSTQRTYRWVADIAASRATGPTHRTGPPKADPPNPAAEPSRRAAEPSRRAGPHRAGPPDRTRAGWVLPSAATARGNGRPSDDRSMDTVPPRHLLSDFRGFARICRRELVTNGPSWRRHGRGRTACHHPLRAPNRGSRRETKWIKVVTI